MNHKIKAGDKVIRLDLNSPFIYTVKKVEPNYIHIARHEKRKEWFTFVVEGQIRLATKQEIYQGYPNG
ncbi:MAG: hypothetical protein [Bacteriophage sp.]|nr:MAG: hypothetical protein [Bacteriophage sp.]